LKEYQSMSNTSPDAKIPRRGGSTPLLHNLRNLFSKYDSNSPTKRPRQEEILLSECLLKLGPDAPFEKRLSFANEFCEFLSQYRLDIMYLTHVWARIKDLFDPGQSPAAKLAGIKILRAFAENHRDRLGLIKSEIMKILRRPEFLQVEVIQIFGRLINRGRDISPHEQEVGESLALWLAQPGQSIAVQQELLSLVNDIIKFGFTQIPVNQRSVIIQQLCQISNSATLIDVVQLCLQCFAEIVCYSYFPSGSLVPFLSALCRTVNIERFSQSTWTIMKNVLNTYGNTSVGALCHILDNEENQDATNLLRGAVFFLGMSVWGAQRIKSLQVSPVQVLPTINRLLSRAVPIIAHEINLAVRRLITKYGAELDQEWEILRVMLEKLHIYYLNIPGAQVSQEVLASSLEAVIVLLETNQFKDDEMRMYVTLSNCLPLLSEASVRTVFRYQIQFVHPFYPNWLVNLKKLGYNYFYSCKTPAIRLKAVSEFRTIFDKFQILNEEEIVLHILPAFADLHAESNFQIGTEALKLLSHMLESAQSTSGIALIELLSQIATKNPLLARSTTEELIRCFRIKWPLNQPLQTIKIYHILCDLLNHSNDQVRKLILDWIKLLRSDNQYRLLYDGISSNYIQLDLSTTNPSNHSPVPRRNSASISLFRIQYLFKILANRLLNESNEQLYLSCMDRLLEIFRNNFMVPGREVNILVYVLQSSLINHSLASCVANLCVEIQQQIFQKTYTLIGMMLIGYRNFLDLDHVTGLTELLIRGIHHRNPTAIQRICVKILSVCFMEFPAGVISHTSILLDKMESWINSQPLQVFGFLGFLINSPKKITLFLREPELIRIFGLFTKLLHSSNPMMKPSLIYRILTNLLLCFDLPKRQEFYRQYLLPKLAHPENSSKSPAKFESANGLPNGQDPDLDLLAKYVFADSVLSPQLDDHHANSFLFSHSDPIGHWHLGSSILSVQIGQANWIRTTLRRASGNSVWISQIQNSSTSRDSRNLHVKISKPTDVFSRLVIHVPEIPEIEIDSEEESLPRPALVRMDSPQSPIVRPLSNRSPIDELLQDLTPEANHSTNSHRSEPLIEMPNRLEGMLMFKNFSSLEPLPDLIGTSNLTTELAEQKPTLPQSGTSPTEENSSLEVILPKNSDWELTRKPLKLESATPLLQVGEFSDPRFNTSPETPSSLFAGSMLTPSFSPLIPFERSSSAESHELPLSSFYPPLLSYEDEQLPSPSFHSGFGADLLGPSPGLFADNKLNEEAQMLLHAGSAKVSSSEDRSPISPESILEDLPFSPNEEPPLKPRVSFDEEIKEPSETPTSPSQVRLRPKKSRSITAPIRKYQAVSSPAVLPSTEFLEFADDLSCPTDTEPADPVIHPSFVFLQMQQVPFTQQNARLIPISEQSKTAIELLDLVSIFDTFKFGICYVKSGQTTEEQILSNVSGSQRYQKFLKSMGNLIRLKNCSKSVYVGGLDRSQDLDGKWSIYFEDEVLQIMYHVITLMPNNSDGLANFNNKKRHIGNDLVNIIYSESEQEFDQSTISGHFNYVNIIIHPLEQGLCLLDCKAKKDLEDFSLMVFPMVVSEENAPFIIRETALLAEVACRTLLKQSVLSNRHERAKQIHQISSRFLS